MQLNIKIENFEGPFDLLIHLIKKNEMDIYNIKIYEITNQYLQSLEKMKEMDLEVTSEFIVIAATLLEIKSKQLLPKIKNDELAAESEEDPEKILVQKLIEYKKFKAAAQFFKSRCEQTGMIFTKKPEIIEEKKIQCNEEIFKNITMLDLYNIYNELINRYNSKLNTPNIITKEISIDAYKIEDKMSFIKEIIHKKSNFNFSELIDVCEVKIEVVVTFLALLELIRLKEVKVLQDENFNEIYVERAKNDEKY